MPRVEGVRETRRKAISSRRVPKGSITKMIGCAIGGDGNCVNGVIITNLEAISSRPDQSEDAPPFPEPGPFLPFLVSDPTLATVIEFLSSSFSNPESHSPRRRRRHRRRRRRRRRCISVVVSLCDTRKFTLVPFRLHSEHPDPSALSPVLCGAPVTLLSLIARNDYLVRWGGTTSGNLRRRSSLAFARNNDLFYDDDSSSSSTLSFSPSAHPHRPREWLSVPNFNQTWPNFRTSGTSGDTTHHLAGFGRSFSFSSPFPLISPISRPLSGDLSIQPLILWSVMSNLFPLFYFDAVYLIYPFFLYFDYEFFFLIFVYDTTYHLHVDHYIL